MNTMKVLKINFGIEFLDILWGELNFPKIFISLYPIAFVENKIIQGKVSVLQFYILYDSF